MHARNVKQTNAVKQLMDAMDASGIFFGSDDASLTWLEIPLEASSPSGPRQSDIGLSNKEARGPIPGIRDRDDVPHLLPFDSRTE